MYNFIIKDNGPDLVIIFTRMMFALAAIAAILYHSDRHYYFNLSLAAILFIAALSVKLLLVRFRINQYVLLSFAVVFLFIATRSIALAFILMVYGYLVKYLKQEAIIAITKEGITIKKLFASPAYQWKEFSNIILKDSLLTLDFKNNKLIQVSIVENIGPVDENAFNDFCKGFLPAYR